MNLRNAGDYNIGIDLGTGSVGWSVSDTSGELFHFKKKPTWGARLFTAGETAQNTRTNRGQRRRYHRRRWRLDLLQSLFDEEMQTVDPDFFNRLHQSRLLKEDKDETIRSYRWPLFNDSGFTESEYYEQFPTIYHLRAYLMETDEQADLRLIYLALHNIVKTRGNFLYQDQKNLTTKNANMSAAIERLADALDDWCESRELECTFRQNAKRIRTYLETQMSEDEEPERLSRSDLKKKVGALIGFAANDTLDAKLAKAAGEALAGAVLGLKADLSKIFLLDDSQSFYLSDEEKVEEFYSVCPDEGVELFEAMQAVYSAYVLMGILKGADDGTISACKIAAYEQYKADLKSLKSLVKKYAPEQYGDFFRGPQYKGAEGHRAKDYDPAKAKGYTKYDLAHSEAYDDFKKEVKKLFEDTAALESEEYQEMMRRFDNEEFLRRLKTSDNGSIPYQFHLEEMEAIIDNQGRFYPFLKSEKEKLTSLVTFRIPYYVGPLTQKNAAKDAQGNNRFAWSERLPGKEDTKIYPWNWEEVIDRKGSAQKFMERLTGTCTYLLDEPVLPRCSLLYEEYCVLNELNGATFSLDGDDWQRFDYETRQGILNDLFKKKRTVKYKDVSEWLDREQSMPNAHVRGGQGENGFESKLTSYIFFDKDIFPTDVYVEDNESMVEELIHWSTLFEDRDILKEKIQEKYGNELNEEQIKAICRKRFTGWGRLSRKLLCGLKTQTDHGPKSIMDILCDGNPNSDHYGSTMVFMEIIRDKDFGFEKLIEDENKKLFSDEKMDVNDLPGSPAVRRSVNQAIRIVEEIIEIAGHDPKNIFVEVTRDEDPKKKGKRTKKRYDAISEAVNAFKEEHSELLKDGLLAELKDSDKNSFDNERLALYFMQGGKCLYTGRELDITRLSTYQVDHILPQSYVKDDSLENKALVFSEANQRKSNDLLLSDDIRRKMRGYWEALHQAGLIGDKKLNNLLCTSISERRLEGFIARQLVETSQSLKFFQLLLGERLPDTRILPVKAGFSSELRNELKLVKCREANSYHHAHDAFIASEVGRFILERHPDMYDNPMRYTKVVRDFIHAEAQECNRANKMPGSSSYIISSFLRSGFDKETGEIFQDAWDAQKAISQIVQFLDYKDCYITRMPEETSGAFWDDTIYSPRDPKKQNSLSLPLKKGLDPKKYGSYSREQFAYFFVYEARSTKKQDKQYVFSSVPVRVAAAVESDSDALDEFAREDAKNQKLEFVRIRRSKIYKYQLLELNGERFFITGFKEMRNAKQLALTQRDFATLKNLIVGNKATDGDCAVLVEDVCEGFSRYAQRLEKILQLDSWSKDLNALPLQSLGEMLCALLQVANAESNVADLSSLGRSSYAGKLQPTFTKEFSDASNQIYFIDQSITGMFESRATL